MNLFETVEKIVRDYERFDEYGDTVNTDFGNNEEGNVVVIGEGDTLIKEDILGNETHKHDFSIIAINQAVTNYDRLKTNDWLLSFASYLRKQRDIEFDCSDGECVIQKIEASKGIVLGAPEDDINNGVGYSLDLAVIYKKFVNYFLK